MVKKRTTVLFAATVVACALVGISAGAATAFTATLLTPAGVTPAADVAWEPMKAPSYPKNDSGESYGSLQEAISPETEPDLILVVATNGKEGYVRKSELNAANGVTATEGFRTPEDALAWQEARAAQGSISISVYAVDGKAEIGTFIVDASIPEITDAG